MNVNTFQSTRIKLTLWYISLSMTITVLFSTFIYIGLTNQLNRMEEVQNYAKQNNIEFNPPPSNLPFPRPPIPDENFIRNLRYSLILILGSVNLGVLVLSSLVGYFLSGRTLKPIKLMLEEQSRFIADASHELRTPLTALKAELEVALMDREANSPKTKNQLQSYLEEVNQLQELTGRLIDLTTLQRSQIKLKFEDISLLEVLEVAVKKISPLAKKKGIVIDLRVDDHIFRGEYTSLFELFTILLDNAIKYSPEKSQITLLSKTEDNYLLVSVQDQGIGIAESDLPHIFNRFFRVDKSRSKHQGFGLGLSIAQELLKSNNGVLLVKSKVGEGSIFIVKLPLKVNSSDFKESLRSKLIH